MQRKTVTTLGCLLAACMFMVGASNATAATKKVVSGVVNIIEAVLGLVESPQLQ